MNQPIYPPAPANADLSKLEPSPAFKQQVGKVVFSIILFFITYLLLVLLATGLAFGCMWACVAIISASPGFLTLMLGVGMLVLGIAVFVFLVKFIFAQTKEDNSMKLEITREQEPALFEFIKKLTEETKTPFPKKIFLSADVNASVSYNSSFWSMFLPVRKNLNIGLGLVNSVNTSEFKAVMAHEFGHFSQRSMKLGSFTYNVNRVIYNMLYNNNSYNSFLSGWSSISGYFAFFAAITAGIANGIRQVLNEMYKFINKSYMGLSREMEFHADAVAASVSGGNNLITALNRVEVSASCYDTTINHANSWLKEKKFTNNLFPHHLEIFRSVAKDHKLELKEGLPEISSHFLDSFSRSRVNFKNQWASHPTLQERTKHLNELNMNVAPIHQSAWAFFSDAAALQLQLTNIIYGESRSQEGLTEKQQDYFISWYQKQKANEALPEVYDGFYNGRILSLKNWDIDFLAAAKPVKNFETIFSKENAQLQENIAYNRNDLETVKNIQSGTLGIKSFDFDGEKKSIQESDSIIAELDRQISTAIEKQDLLQKESFTFFQQQNPADKRLTEAYKKMAKDENLQQEFADAANAVLKRIQPFYEGNNTLDFIHHNIGQLKEKEEKALKEKISELIQAKWIGFESKEGILDKAIAFKNKDYAYFHDAGGFHNEELNELTSLIFGIDGVILDYRWEQYKQLLELQLEYHKPA